MASIYYGKSNTAANERTKVVVCPSALDGGNLRLQYGDLLVVLFQQGNTYDAIGDNNGPLLLIANGDSNDEVNESNENGIPIKVQSNEISLNGAWVEGETKIFVYTHGDVTPEVYFSLVGSVKGSSTVSNDNVNKIFGNVAIVDTPNASSAETAADGVAISPYGAQLLASQSSGLNLDWSGPSSGATTTLLGNLSLRKDNEVLGTTIPIYQYIQDIPEYTHTHQFWNDGPKSDNTDNNKYGVGQPFLTRYIPGEVNFYHTSGQLLGINYIQKNQAGTEIDYNSKQLVYEVADRSNPSNTNIFGLHNLTLNAAPGYWIVTGATPESYPRSGSLRVNGDLKVRAHYDGATGQIDAEGLIYGKNGLTIARGVTNLKTTQINGGLTVDTINNHKLRHVRTALIDIPINATGVNFSEPDAQNFNCILLTMQDNSLGVLGTYLDRSNRSVNITFINKNTVARKIRINYILFNHDD